MVTVEDFSRLVSGIYAAALTPQQWGPAMRVVQHTFDGSNASGLLMSDGSAWSIDNSTLPPRIAQSYEEYYYRLDRVLAALEQGPVGAVRTGTELMPLVRRSEFYEEWLRPLEIDGGLFVRLTGGPRPTCFIVAAPRRTESFDTPERAKLMTRLVPHLQQALRIQNRLTDFAHSSADLAGALEAVRHGVAVIGSGCLVLHLNSTAERILAAGDGLHSRAGCVAAGTNECDRKLQRAIHFAVLNDGSNIRHGQSFACERPSGKRPYIIHVLPLHRIGADETSTKATALVLIMDPEREIRPAAMLLRHVYGLTNTEAEVAVRMAHGSEVKQISEELSMSLTTVRTHLQHIFDKTGTHRQAELVRSLLTLIP
jgi:DNA-binding CsgD family transcriptional regulator